MKSKMLSVWVALIVLTVCVAPVWAQRRVPEFRLYSDFFPELPPIPPLPPMPPMPPLEHFYFELPYQARTAAAVDPQVSLQQEAFRSLLKISPDRA
ncbi:MAG: hypothetical protein HY646_03480, partial [Acidobacteria bacterium]|nr:hypothetical protein [Acidobacteriota bacterium]